MMCGRIGLLMFCIASLNISFKASANESIAETPPMGWNSWNQFGCNINETLIRETADAMVHSGMKKAGYRYIVVDDCWQAKERDENGNLQPDPERFPSGMKALADYIHSKGLKFGLYTSVGKRTCEGYPASYNHEEQDAKTFASWEVDLVKDDFCIQGHFWWPWWNYKRHYEKMSESLRATGRPILLSLCNWGFGHVEEWGGSIAQMWRTTFDISPHWYRIMQIVDAQVGLEKYAGPNHWNDPDMLEVGNPPLTETESKAHFSLWAILTAPLFAGNDLRTMDHSIRAILTAPEVIAVNQDPAGIQGRRVYKKNGVQIWAKPMSDFSTVAVVLLNRTSSPKLITIDWETIGFFNSTGRVRNIWERKDLGTFKEEYSTEVMPHEAVMITVRKP
jgi:alpha-galactosidase